MFGALLGREFGRFVSSPNYMLNCGLAILLIPAVGLLLLFKGDYVFEVMGVLLQAYPGAVPVLLCTVLCMLASMNYMATPSVSLEDGSLL